MKKCTIFFFVTLIVILSSCATITINKGKSSKLNTNKTYLFGRFTLIKGFNKIILSVKSTTLSENPTTFELVKSMSADKLVCGINFDKSNEIRLYELEPGKYTINEWIAALALNEIAGRGYITDKRLSVMKLEPGKAYYIGDWEGKHSIDQIQNHWEITKISDNYDNSVKDLISKYSLFYSIEKINLLNNVK